jgi:hypothetical protein
VITSSGQGDQSVETGWRASWQAMAEANHSSHEILGPRGTDCPTPASPQTIPKQLKEGADDPSAGSIEP